MKILKAIHNRFTLIGICSSKSKNPFIHFRNAALAVTCLLINVASIFASLVFIEHNLKTDLENSLHAVLALSAATALCYMMIVTYILRHELTDIFAAFQDIHDKYEYIDPEKVMDEANKRSAMILKCIDCFVGLCLVTTAIQMIGSLIYSFSTFAYANPEILYRPFRMALPWDRNCLSGWIVEGVYYILSLAASLFIAMPFLMLFISFLSFHRAFNKIYHTQFKKMDALTRIKAFRSCEVKKLLFETVSFEVFVKSLFRKTERLYGSFVLVFLINAILGIAATTFQMDLAIRHLDLTFFTMLFALAYGLAHLYAYCYVGRHSTDYYLAYADYLYESNWMYLPIELQRTFILMIVHAQRPLRYHGFHVAVLDFELFTKMIKTVVSYYLMFKTFAEL